MYIYIYMFIIINRTTHDMNTYILLLGVSDFVVKSVQYDADPPLYVIGIK